MGCTRWSWRSCCSECRYGPAPGRKHIEEHLRAAVLEIRRQQVSSILDVDTGVFATKMTTSLVHSLVAHLRRFFVDPETEKDKDIWDLTAFGTTGTAWFTSIS